jgi:S-adenosylmethionine:diacylglycerol 3-amino-3-carboxypropyl transferase
MILLWLGRGDSLFQDSLETEENHKYPVKLDGNLAEIRTDSESLQCKLLLRSSYQKFYAFLNAYFFVTNVSHI